MFLSRNWLSRLTHLMSKLGNTLAMLKLLETGRKYSAKELAERLEVTPRQVKTYKDELEKTGIYIDTIRGIYGGYVYHKKNNYEISFDYQDVDSIETILNKLTDQEKEKINVTLEKIRTIVIYSSDELRNIKIDKQELREKYCIISKAIKEKGELYFKFHNKPRRFIPYTFTYYKDFIYVTGYSIDENDIKTLNLAGIEEL